MSSPPAPAFGQGAGDDLVRRSTDGPTRGRLFRIGPAVVALFGLVAVYAARDLEVGTLVDPGPGLWPISIASLVTVTGALLVWRDIPADYESWTSRALLVVAAVAVLGVFVVLFESLGFVVAAVLMLFVWLKVLAGESWWISIGLALVGAVALDLVFEGFFDVPFPAGFVRLGGA